MMNYLQRSSFSAGQFLSIPNSGISRFLFCFFLSSLLLFAAVSARAATISIGRFSESKSTNMAFNSTTRTWTLASAATNGQLDVTQLISSLNDGNVTISNTTGNITVTNGSFDYAATAARTLTFSATGNIEVSQLNSTGSPVTYVVNATGNVSVGPAGLNTNGGAFTSSGVNFTVTGGPVSTRGAAFTLNHSGASAIDYGGVQTSGGAFSNNSGSLSAASVNTLGGKFYHNGGNLTVNAGGVSTGGGDVEIISTGNVSISINGIVTGTGTTGGNFSSKGINFSATNNSVKSYGGDVVIDHTGTVTVGSMLTGGGNYLSKGTTLTLTEGGLGTSGGSVVFQQTGAILITGGGVQTGGGTFQSQGAGLMTIEQAGLSVGASPLVRIVHAGITVWQGGFSGTNTAAEILLHGGCNPVSLDIINVNGNLNVVGNTITIGHMKANGAAGVLNLNATAASTITLNNSIQTQGGNVVMHALGKIDLKTNPIAAEDPDGIVTLGGAIELKSRTSIASGNNPGLTTGTGSGGVLTRTANPSGSITLTGTPVVGAGNITLVTDPALTIPFGVGAPEICNGIDDDCDGSIDEGLTCDPLPVKLINFSAEKQEQVVLLEWTTSEESNSARFDIQRSGNGKSWSTLGSLKTADQGVQHTSYVYKDATPLKGTNLYRLKMVDHDGTFALSSIRSITTGSKELDIFAYPNPSAERVDIQMADWNKVKSVQLLNKKGQIVYDSFAKPVSQISVKNLAQGLYILNITLKDGTSLTHKIIRE